MSIDNTLDRVAPSHKALLDALAVQAQLLDRRRRVLYANKQLRLLIGADPSGARCHLIMKDNRRPCSNCPLKHPDALPTTTVIEIDGVFGGRTFRITHSPVALDGEDLILETLVDITQQKLTARALEESEQRFRELLELLPETVFEADAAGRVTFGNQVAYEKFGYTVNDFERGVNLLDTCATSEVEQMKSNMAKVLNGARVRPREYTLRKADGTNLRHWYVLPG